MDKLIIKPLIWSDNAKADLENIHNYIRADNKNAADKFVAGSYAVANTIPQMPLSYPECRFLPTKRKSYRNIPYGNYLIVYKISPENIKILSVFHCSRNPSQLKRTRKR